MKGPGRLSLRARLLVVLIAVTAAFLLVMGGVTAFALSKRLGTRFDDALISAAARSPDQIQANPGDYVAVLITHRFPLTVQPLTGSTGTTQELVDAIEKMAPANGLRANIKDVPFLVRGTSPPLRAVARLVPRSGLSARVGFRRGLADVLVVASPVNVVAGQVRGIVVTELITGGALILLLALGGRWLIGRGLAPLSEMAGTAQRITTQGDLTARMPDADGSTEVGRLGTAINTMLDRIQQAFGARLRSEAKVRQFAADASHELRTPLTTIRGYAELYGQGALDDDQLPDAMRRIEQEARRMGTLVAELLELARLDRTSSLDVTETDLAVLVRDAAADARAVEPARPVRAEAPESLVAAVDEARIRQVLANLLGNVREHTPVTTPTAVRLAQVRGGVVLEVADSGPGMAAEDAARAFDRFHRGTDRRGGEAAEGPAVGYGAGAASPHSANGSRPAAESGGSGLGLAIVAAIAQAHGGQATLESAPGHGTRVRVWLPTTAPATPAAPRVAATPRLSRARHRGGQAAPRPADGTPWHAAPPVRRPASGATNDPAPRHAMPAQPTHQPSPGPNGDPAPWRSAPPARQPSPGPADGPPPWHAAPPAQPTHQPSSGPTEGPIPWHAAPPARQPLSGPAEGPPPWHAAPPAQPAHQPSPGPADDPAAWHSAPPVRQPSPGPAEGPPPWHAAPPGRPVPSWRPAAGPPRAGPPPTPHRNDGMLLAAPIPPAPAVPVPHPGGGYPGPAELHHDWGDPPRPVPPRPPAGHDAAHDGDGYPADPAVAPWRRLPPPGRHGRVGGAPNQVTPEPDEEGR
jgi:signal transduction histidine kinase